MNITRSTSLKLCCLGAALFATTIFETNHARGSLLVGTFVGAPAESLAQMNQLIADYNSDFGAALPAALARIDKIEGESPADFEDGVYSLTDFDFYHRSTGGSVDINVFDTLVEFTPSTLGVADGFDLDNPVFAFEQLSGPAFTYYVSKGGNQGWSLWAVMPGINPAYTDLGTGASSIVGSNFTRGVITNNALDFDPSTQGVSHISFYSSVPGSDIPEPSTMVLMLFGCLMVFRRRR
jgi:hypothetical protein